MITAILKFEIRNTFAEWEQAFYSHQPIARAAGIFEKYHGHEPDNENKVWTCIEVESMEKMMAMASSPGMIKLREEAGAKIETQTWTQLVE